MHLGFAFTIKAQQGQDRRTPLLRKLMTLQPSITILPDSHNYAAFSFLGDLCWLVEARRLPVRRAPAFMADLTLVSPHQLPSISMRLRIWAIYGDKTSKA